MINLNQRASDIAADMQHDAAFLKIQVSEFNRSTILDCGINTPGTLQAGLELARVCLAGLAEVELVDGTLSGLDVPSIRVSTDYPVLACLASQYAGWQVSVGKFFAMGSGPMRAASAREEIFQHVPGKEDHPRPVGVLETRKMPTDDVVADIFSKFTTPVEHLTLLVAPASSIAGTIQVVARSVETALHKLHTLHFNVNNVVAGFGSAPLPPVAKDELKAIGRTNDAILYGGRVTLWVNCDDAELEAIGPQVPSSSSKDHGSLFGELFARYGDFYKIDPLLFSPAQVTFCNLKTGRAFHFGQVDVPLLQKSFFG